MTRVRRSVIVVALAATLGASCGKPAAPPASVPLFDDLGTHHRAITTRVPAAQQYFDQGLRLLWAFNHDESTRSFAKAAELDPQCAICDWGVALTVGPNYNLPFIVESRAKLAFDETKAAASKGLKNV